MIIPGSKYGDARKQASQEDPHGLTPNTIEQLRDRFEEFLPGMANSHGQASKQFFDGLLPDGAELTPSRNRKQANFPGGSVNFSGGGGLGGGGGGGAMITPQRPYQPEFECVIEGTSVVMADGTLKNIEEIKVGDRVLDKNGNEQEVLHHWCSGVPDELVELCVWGGNKLYSTTNHNFPIYTDGKLEKIPAGEINSGYLTIPRKFDVSNTSISLDEARLLGYYLAEGSLLRNKNDLPYSEVEFTLSILEKDTIVKDIKDILFSKNINFNTTEIPGRNVIRIRTRGGNSELVKWLFTNGGHLNSLKFLSKEVLGWPVKLKIELVKGLLRGDGSQFYKISRTKGKEGKSFEVTYITASRNLSSQIRLVLSQIGYPSRCVQTKSGFDKKIGFRRNPHYRLTITGQYARDIADLVWEENSKSSLIDNKNPIKHKCLMDDKFIYVPIKKVNILDNKTGIPVYNMTVSGDHSYLIENIGTYNSPDRQQYPVHRILANRYWRLFYKLDPVIGNCIDMYCMPAGEKVLTPSGISNIEDLSPGDHILSSTGEVQTVLLGGSRQYSGAVYQIKGQGLLPFTLTGDHRVKVIHRQKVQDKKSGGHGRWEPMGEPVFIPAKELSIGDYLIVPKLRVGKIIEYVFDLCDWLLPTTHMKLHDAYNISDKNIISKMQHKNQNIVVRRHISMSDDLAELFGWYVAEGSRTRHNLEFSFHKDEIEYADRVAYLCCSIFGITEKSINRYYTKNNGLRVTICSTPISSLFAICGESALTKTIPECIIIGRTSWKTRFLEAYLKGDGCIKDKTSSIKANTVSEILAYQLQLIGTAIGVFFNLTYVNRSHHKEKYGINRSDVYTLTAKKRDVYPIILGEDHNININMQTSIREKDDYYLIPIKSIEIEDFEGEVFDIKTPDESFCLPAIVHNSTMPWSDFQLSGEGITGEIKETLEAMCMETGIQKILEYMVKEFMVIGEAVPHCFFDETKGIWSYIALHNPDQLEVIDAPFIKMDPIVEFIPDDRLRAVLTSNNHLLRSVRDQMPPELISRLIARQNIPLSPVNMTFIPRRMHPYDTRGTSIISRMWRILMYEDAIYNASISTARRHAGPIKVAKLGNPQTGWIPSQEHERRLLQLLAQAELDVNAWLVYHYGIQFELVGTTDRIMNISQHHEVIERIKLIALGISKSFLHGEVTYASSITGLSVFLQRMKSLRNFFVNNWLLPKFFKPIAQINGWVRRDKKELTYRYRIKRSQREIEMENRWIIPKIEWEKQLDATINTELVTAMNSLEQMGIQFSKTTKYAAVGRKFEEELRKIKDEQEFEQELNEYMKPPAQPGGGAPGGAPGGGMPPLPKPPGGAGPAPTGAPGAPPAGGMPTPPGGGNIPNAPGGGGAEADKTGEGGGSGPSGKRDPAEKDTESNLWDHKGRFGNWSAHEVQDLKNLLTEGFTDSPLWAAMDGPQLRKAINAGDVWEVVELIDEHLRAEGYPSNDVKQLKKVLDKEGVLRDIADGETLRLTEVENNIGDGLSNLNDSEALDRLAAQLDGQTPDIVKMGDSNNLFVGHGNESWSGDIGGIIGDKS